MYVCTSMCICVLFIISFTVLLLIYVLLLILDVFMSIYLCYDFILFVLFIILPTNHCVVCGCVYVVELLVALFRFCILRCIWSGNEHHRSHSFQAKI